MLLRAVLFIVFVAGSAAAKAAAPVVYADDYIEIGAGIAEAGTAAMHLGDELTLVVEATFDADAVQVESPGAEWFRRVFGELGAVSLTASDETHVVADHSGRIRLTARWRFQVVGCPPRLENCPGTKRYELPLANLTYRLISDRDGTVVERSARFTPWPGHIDLVPAIRFDSSGDTAIAEVIPGGAWPAPVSNPHTAVVGVVTIVAGGLLFATGLLAGRHRGRRPTGGHHAPPDSRWQNAARGLLDPALDDEAWSDLLRRSITWYCLDELGRNPVEWLRATRVPVDPAVAECRALYLEVLGEEGISENRRETFRTRWARATGSGVLAGNGWLSR